MKFACLECYHELCDRCTYFNFDNTDCVQCHKCGAAATLKTWNETHNFIRAKLLDYLLACRPAGNA